MCLYAQIPIILVGNKMDLEESERAVTQDEGKQWAGENGAAFMEASAKLNKVLDPQVRVCGGCWWSTGREIVCVCVCAGVVDVKLY